MSLTVREPITVVTIVAPVHRISTKADPNWQKVEAVASRFKLPSHRVAVRVYLYAVLRDVKALRRFGDPLLYRRKLRNAIRRGKRHLEQAREAEPELFARLMADFAPHWARPGDQTDSWMDTR